MRRPPVRRNLVTARHDGGPPSLVRVGIRVRTGAAEPRGPGGQLTPTFSGAGSTYGA